MTTPDLVLDPHQIMRKYQKHAADFGLPTNYNPENGERLIQALLAFVERPTIVVTVTEFWGNLRINYVDPETRLHVKAKLDGTFVSCWRLEKGKQFNRVMAGLPKVRALTD